VRLTGEVARELAYCSVGTEYEGFMVVHNELIDTDRWSTIHLLVVQDLRGLGFWGHPYSQGATEYQDERPFEYLGGVEFERYYAKPVRTTEWVKEDYL